MKKVNFEGETANPVHALHTSAKKTHTGTYVPYTHARLRKIESDSFFPSICRTGPRSHFTPNL